LFFVSIRNQKTQQNFYFKLYILVKSGNVEELDQLTVGQLTVGQLTVGQLTVGQLTVGEACVGQYTPHQFYIGATLGAELRNTSIYFE
jgi:hypothetical protein